jgi:ferritin
MMTEKLQKALNEQITAELWSANLYLSMSFFLLREGYEGFAHWMRKQSAEEIKHANEIAEYMVNRQAIPRIDKIDVVPQNW